MGKNVHWSLDIYVCVYARVCVLKGFLCLCCFVRNLSCMISLSVCLSLTCQPCLFVGSNCVSLYYTGIKDTEPLLDQSDPPNSPLWTPCSQSTQISLGSSSSERPLSPLVFLCQLVEEAVKHLCRPFLTACF